jgi:hypothetical protein
VTAKSLENLLNPRKDGDLADLVRRARDMGELATALAAAVPPEEGAAIVAANFREDGELVVLCRSSAWASRLRFAADALLAAARTTGAEVTRCTVRVACSDHGTRRGGGAASGSST